MRVKYVLVCFSLLLGEVAAIAQVFDLEKNRVPAAELNCLWRFQTGDAAGWADAAFNDASWPLVRPDRSYFDQGYRGYSGLSWYRLKVVLPPQPMKLALLVPQISDSYQVFANGHLIGEEGGLPPKAKAVMAPDILFPIPDDAVRPGQPLVLAIRVWRWQRMAQSSGGGMDYPPILGDPGSLKRLQSLVITELYWRQTGSIFDFFANLITGLAVLGLFALRPREREYLWFGCAQMFWAAIGLLPLSGISKPVSYVVGGITYLSCLTLAQFLNLEFFVTLLGQRKRFLYWTAFSSIAISLLLIVPTGKGWIADPHITPVTPILEFVYGICVPMMLVKGVRRGKFEARVLIAPFTLSFLCNVAVPWASFQTSAPGPVSDWFYAHIWNLVSWPIPMNVAEVAGDLAMFSVVAVLVLRFARSRRDEERLAAELEAARVVQHVLIPDEIPTVPGFHIECVYKPAGDLGGDFFQILPLPAGAALAVIGDVSGKGTPAAMTVSMLIGMLRMLILSTQSPAEILTTINRHMMGRFPGGFITCLILYIDRNGALTAANAGHVFPYLNGKELWVENGLPLGLEASASYFETRLELSPEDQITLLTDGVVEARAASGELFGFDRAASISAQPATEIAAAAEGFGQQDDITVLSLTRRSPGEEALGHGERTAWSHAHA